MFAILLLPLSVLSWALCHLVRIRVKTPTSWWESIIDAVFAGLFSLFWFFILGELALRIFGRKWDHFPNIQEPLMRFIGYAFPFLWLIGPLAAAAWLLMKPDGWKKFLQVSAPAPPASDTETKLLNCSRCKAVLFGQETTCRNASNTLKGKTKVHNIKNTV